MELEQKCTELHQKITMLNEAQEQNWQLQEQLEHSQVCFSLCTLPPPISEHT